MPRVLWKRDDNDRIIFQTVENFELYLAQSLPHVLALLANILFAIIIWIEISLETLNNATPNSYRGLFYQQNGPLNILMKVLRALLGPRAGWGTSRIIHDDEEPRWPQRLDLEAENP